MNRRLTVTVASALCLAGAASPAFATDLTVVGQVGQANGQGANSNQSGVNGTGGAGGDNSVFGDAAPELNQNSANAGVNVEAVGGSGDSTLIANGPTDGFTQSNESGTNSDQVGENGDSGSGIGSSTPLLNQNSANVSVSVLLIAPSGNNVLIGGSAQAAEQGVNSSQSGNNFPGGGETGAFNQNSLNVVINAVILGG
jgi:hypothetical protein